MNVCVRDMLNAIDDAFPFHWADEWDNVGLLVGDPNSGVDGVLVSLDLTPQTLARTIQSGANVLVTHHPAFLRPPQRITPRSAGIAFAAVERGVALIAAHTNLDRSPAAGEVLPRMLGLEPGVPLEDSHLALCIVTVYLPQDNEREVAAAMSVAGAGRIGEYRACSFAASGTGSFIPAPDAAPSIGSPGQPSTASEVRLEMVAPPEAVDQVVAAARSAHPYEEPLITISDHRLARGAARMGRISALQASTDLGALADKAAKAFGITPRVWGSPDTHVSVIATATGSAGSLVSVTIHSDADVLLAGEVRYHDALAATSEGLAIIEIGHDVSEWPLVPVLAEAVSATPGLDPDRVAIDSPTTAWWTP